MPRRSKVLAVSREGEEITEAHVRHAVSTGVTFGVLVPGLVPPYEEHDARVAVRCTLTEWRAMEPAARALEVAHYRLRRAVSLHSEDARADAAERESKRASRHR